MDSSFAYPMEKLGRRTHRILQSTGHLACSNIYTYGQPHGSRQPANASWSVNINLFWDTVSTNIMAGGLLVLISLCSLGLFQKWRNGTEEERFSWTWVYILWSIIGLQTFLTLYSSSTVLLDPINTRLTAGIYCVFILLAVIGVRQFPIGFQRFIQPSLWVCCYYPS